MHQVVFFNSMFYVRVLPYTWKECSLKFPKGSPHELPIFRQSLQWRMYHVPYSMSGFLQLIADGSPNKHQRKKKSKGRNRREYKRTPSRKHSVNNFWIRIVERNRFPELTSFWLRFVLKECSLKFTKGPPHKLRNFRQSLTDVPCSSIFYVWVSAADNWWQPKQTSRKKGKQVVVTPRLPQQNALQHCFHAEITVVPLRNWFESQAAAAIHASVKNLRKFISPGQNG